ncbi:MAG: HAMP domain-containing histidine kinase [Lachnospiraceae bacterium]|nr:HAMP domain-containing histidine kinase [Lachnospiraceae bacterium]
MKIQKITAAFTLLMLVFLFYLINLFLKVSYPERDIVFYNDQLNRIEDDIRDGRSEQSIEYDYGCRIIYSKDIGDPELVQLYRKDAFVLDLNVDGEYLGKVAWLEKKDGFEQIGSSFFSIALLIWACSLLLGYVLLYIIYDSYIKPSKELKNFSEELAKGNLDVSLPIKSNNFFVGFTESFDIMREELKRARKNEIESEIARKELVASLSHDVKTPVAVIEAIGEVMNVKLNRRLDKLKETVPNDEESIAEVRDSLEKVQTVAAKAKTISSLMNDLLHSNMENLEMVEVCVGEEYTTLIEDYFIKIKGYGKIILENSIPRCMVYLDRRRMEQCIDNIIGNSVKYAGTDISVRFDTVDDMLMSDGLNGNFIRITIKDHGPGVSEEDLPLVAQKYYRGANADEKPGYGMGLYLVKQYMKKQGGDMEYYNDNGFTVVLMLKKV